MSDSFGAKGTIDVDGTTHAIYRLDALEERFRVSRLPYSMKVLLENLLRHEDGVAVTAADIEAVASWDGGGDGAAEREISYLPGRVLMQDFTGVPAVVDLAAMRDAVAERGGDAASLDPLIPADLVIDHSVSVDHYAGTDSLALNTALEFARNAERYQFLRWGQQAFDSLRVVPPETGICHQVNLERLSTVVATRDGVAFPDTCVGTDSHTPMVNGLGVVAWGVGGIEAEAALLNQPISMLIPKVIGIRLVGALPAGTTATDLVLTVTELLRHHGVVGTFVEFYGPGVANVPVENRATIGNMSPEYGSTITIFPIDDETLRYLRFSGRPDDLVVLVEAYAKEQGLWHDPERTPTFTEIIELDLATIEASLAGPARPQDRVPLRSSKAMFCDALATSLPVLVNGTYDEAVDESFPASDPPAATAGVSGAGEPDKPLPAGTRSVRPHVLLPVTLADGTQVDLDHGHVAIAAITSCTNTSNPSVMLAAGLLARNAVERGLTVKPWVKTSLAPGSKVSVDYFERSGLQPALDKLGFNVVGFGCTTCIGNSGPLDPAISAAAEEHGLALVAVLSGNRNFEGRINPDVRMSYLASPPLVVAYALAGTMDIDLATEPLGRDPDGAPVLLADVWPGAEEIAATIREFLAPEGFADAYATAFVGGSRWQALETPDGPRFTWDAASTYVQRPPYFDEMPDEPVALADIEGARVLAVLGDSVTTDHISPAGAIHPDSPAGRWLVDHGVERTDFNSYGSRRGNHQVMIRGTFANRRIRNRLAPGTEGGVTLHQPSGDELAIYDAAERYRAEGVPLVLFAGTEYGSGSSRDWAAKGTMLLGICAVIAESYERIHRSNLVGMGVLPLQFTAGTTCASLGLTGTEVVSVAGIAGVEPAALIGATLTVVAGDVTFEALVRIDTPTEAAYYHHGGILPYVVRQHLREHPESAAD